MNNNRKNLILLRIRDLIQQNNLEARKSINKSIETIGKEKSFFGASILYSGFIVIAFIANQSTFICTSYNKPILYMYYLQ